MYPDQFTPWQPREMLVDTVTADLGIASTLYSCFVSIEVEEYLAIRVEVTWIIAEMMGYHRPFSDDSSQEVA